MSEFAVAVDLGGTNLRVALVDKGGKIWERVKLLTSVAEGKEAIVRKLVEGIEKVYQRCSHKEIRGIGLGIAGAIDIKKGTVTHSPNLPGWENYPLKDHIVSCAAKGKTVVLENDANVAALGELWKGAGMGMHDLICLTLGTGIGGGIVAGGKLLHGVDGMAGEVGHMTIKPDGPRCNCGNAGCLEALASATAIRREAIEASDTPLGTLLLEASGGDHEAITAELVYELAVSGDPASVRIYQAMGRYLGIGVANLINIFNPEGVIIGGGVSSAWKMFIASTVQEVHKRAFKIPAQRAKLVQALCGDDAALLGAAYLVFTSDQHLSHEKDARR